MPSASSQDALADMPPRDESELDPVTLHNQALIAGSPRHRCAFLGFLGMLLCGLVCLAFWVGEPLKSESIKRHPSRPVATGGAKGRLFTPGWLHSGVRIYKKGQGNFEGHFTLAAHLESLPNRAHDDLDVGLISGAWGQGVEI